jgi:hypothetical protein
LISDCSTAYSCSSAHKAKADTTFLLRENSDGIYHAILVDENLKRDLLRLKLS